MYERERYRKSLVKKSNNEKRENEEGDRVSERERE